MTTRTRVPSIPEFPPAVLREYTLLADGERGAVIGPRGDVAWLCAPRWDSPAVCSSLIGGAGRYAITPDVPFVWGGHYEPGSMIWRCRWVTTSGIVECREALAYPAGPDRLVLIRRIIAVDCDARMRIQLELAPDYGKSAMTELKRSHGVWTARLGSLHVRWSGAPDARRRGGGLHTGITVPAGQHHDLILEIDMNPPPDPLIPDHTWRVTEAAWAAAVPELTDCLSPHDVRSSIAVLRGLTSRDGGMVAAATTSLPERAEAGRNYDYRYAWIRDQCYAGLAVAALGPHPLLDAAVRTVSARVLEHGDRLAPAYTVTGEPVPDQHHIELPGYPGGFDIVGNWVNGQFQLDVFGEALLLLAAAAGYGGLDPETWRAAETAAGAIAKRWTEPDAGIWEIDNRPWTHSRLIAAAGLRAMAAAHPAGRMAAEWLSLADAIVAHTAAHALTGTGRWQRSPDDPAVDAALLLPGLRGAVPPDDPRTIATLDAYRADLTSDGYAYRFRHDDRPLTDAEGSFLLCGFLTALSLHQQGDVVEARAWYERTRTTCGAPQLFAEEFDTQQHQLRGNLPQAFVHALMVETSARLSQPPGRPPLHRQAAGSVRSPTADGDGRAVASTDHLPESSVEGR
jgi:alpha,alpha-trehalase